MKKYDIWNLDLPPKIADYKDMDDRSATHLIIIALLFLVIVNLFMLDITVYRAMHTVRLADVQTSAVPSTTPILLPPATAGCDELCKAAIKQEVTTQLATKQPVSGYQPPVASQPREFFIPLGSGSTTAATWQDLPATETQVNPRLYGSSTTAYFIVSLRNPTKNGQVEAQLYNVTDQHPVWGSQVAMTTETTQTLTSPPISLESTAKTYRVQLKSTLGYEVFVDTAKLRISGK